MKTIREPKDKVIMEDKVVKLIKHFVEKIKENTHNF